MKIWSLSLKRTWGKIFILLTLLYLLFLYLTSDHRFSRTRVNVSEDEDERAEDVLLTSAFISGQPKQVVILSYQRTGSSFLGEWFNTNPDVFYSFEPIDSLYSAMYGTNQNENVPSDITNYPNGSLRILPKKEILSVSQFLQQYLSCDLGKMPTQTLLSFYFLLSYNHLQSTSYSNCVRPLFSFTFRKCEPISTAFCGGRFGQVSEERQKRCFELLWENQDLKNGNLVLASGRNVLIEYKTCVSLLRQSLKATCEHLLLDACQRRRIRVMKTVRATMDSMEPLFETLPNFRVVHLIRDPRAVALSRRLFPGYVLGIHSGNDSETLVKEAKLYCSTVVRDFKVRRKLETRYPGKIYGLIFEELITNTSKYLENVYRFLDAKPHELTVNWLSTQDRTNTERGRMSVEFSKKWQNVLSFTENKKIVESCKEFFQLVRHNWTM